MSRPVAPRRHPEHARGGRALPVRARPARRLPAWIVALAVCGGCASGTGGAGAGGAGGRAADAGIATVQTATLQNAAGSARGVNLLATTEVHSVAIAAPVGPVFDALTAAYASLGIPVAEIDQQARTVGNPSFRARRRIGTVPAVRALDCGGDSGMPNAETYELRLAIRSRVVPGEGGGSVLQTTVEGTARNATTAASSDVRCSSQGALERRLGEVVKAAVSGKPPVDPRSLRD
ncbi:MAG: hypothetical protein KJT01_06120 [Gemmatimonadetes bacterium]|nr:hypothetical protein [Gemmatimonadota bacterium]